MWKLMSRNNDPSRRPIAFAGYSDGWRLQILVFVPGSQVADTLGRIAKESERRWSGCF